MSAISNTRLLYREFGRPETVIHPEDVPVAPLAAGMIRVAMRCSPVNASDLIPVTGAYRHRITLPCVAGYEGVGIVNETSPGFEALMGKRVLPLKGEGTWQRSVTAPGVWAVPVPDAIGDNLAGRAYINPLAAVLMLEQHPVKGKTVMLTAAGSDCATWLAALALRQGARRVIGIYRSEIHASRLAAAGVIPVSQTDYQALSALAAEADLVFDATGGTLANDLLRRLPPEAHFVCYGLLSGQPFAITSEQPAVHWFHIRNVMPAINEARWPQLFHQIWPLMPQVTISGTRAFPLADWREAIRFYYQPGRTEKPVIEF